MSRNQGKPMLKSFLPNDKEMPEIRVSLEISTTTIPTENPSKS
ncbi:MAG: hypothetical protein VKL59_08325 [Nostocaceae cyanobacterium]|nr:hypothetical protein [Nostocaceae cyanobacterium]